MIQQKGPFDRVSQSYKLIDDWIFGKRHNKIPWQQICDWYLNFIGRQKVQTTSKRPTTTVAQKSMSTPANVSYLILLRCFRVFMGNKNRTPPPLAVSASSMSNREASIAERDQKIDWC